ncbi:MAG: MetQ/NlpA family ABC transporter substrate-binding protein [Spirochaetales bacterium]
MKKTILILLTVSLVCSVFAFGSKEDDKSVLKVGATPVPHAEMLNLVIDNLAEQGITLEVIEFTDYVTPNEAVESNEIHANFFQHAPYMDTFNYERKFSLVNAGGIHIEPIAVYSQTITRLDDLKDGATVAIPNDPTNEGRALLLLESAGLIELNPAAGIEATPYDITKNPKNLKFHEIEAASLPRVLGDVDIAIINGNYAIPAGLSAAKDGLFVEGADSPYVNIVAVKAGMETDERIIALIQALQSQEIANYIAEFYPNGEVVKVF